MGERADERLRDIVDATEELANHLKGLSYDDFCRDQGSQRIAERLLEVAGEAATHVPDEIAQTIDVDWDGLRALRVVLPHAYHRVEVSRLWSAATLHLPRLALGAREFVE